MKEYERIQAMTIDELTTNLVRILSCNRCICRDLCEQIKADGGADGEAPCPTAIKKFLESEAQNENNIR